MSGTSTFEPAVAPGPVAAPSRGLVVAAACWLAIVLAAMAGLWAYKDTPGAVVASPPAWPAESRLAHARGTPALVMFVLPMCPCTRASLTELNALLQAAKGTVDAHVVIVLPEGADAAWREQGSNAQARAIPGATVHEDMGGREARIFQARTSGLVLFFDGDDRLRFSGGITGSRGHEGDNAGAEAVDELLRGGTPRIASWPVFGCALEAPRPEGDR